MLNYKGGIKPDSHKYTKNIHTTDALSPDSVSIFLNGSVPCVECGTIVSKGQTLTFDYRCHASVSGEVISISNDYITINNNRSDSVSDECRPFPKRLADSSLNDIISFISKKSIYFDKEFLDLKLKKAAGNAKLLLVSCGETTPFNCSRKRITDENKKEIIFGAQILMKALSIHKAVITLEASDFKNTIEFKKALKKAENISLITHTSKYPAENELVLKKAFIKKYYNNQDFAEDNILLITCEESVAIFKAFKTGLPMIDRVVTIDGDAVRSPKNLIVPLGTSFSDIFKICDVDQENDTDIVINNPICSVYHRNCDHTRKDISCILSLYKKSKPEKSYQCISCKKCVDVCPIQINPIEVLKSNMIADKCVVCGACTYICPAKIDFSAIYNITEDK